MGSKSKTPPQGAQPAHSAEEKHRGGHRGNPTANKRVVLYDCALPLSYQHTNPNLSIVALSHGGGVHTVHARCTYNPKILACSHTNTIYKHTHTLSHALGSRMYTCMYIVGGTGIRAYTRAQVRGAMLELRRVADSTSHGLSAGLVLLSVVYWTNGNYALCQLSCPLSAYSAASELAPS